MTGVLPLTQWVVANVYPENVTVGLEQSEVRQWVTGKFVTQVREDPERNRSLWVAVELTAGEAANEERKGLCRGRDPTGADAPEQRVCELRPGSVPDS